MQMNLTGIASYWPEIAAMAVFGLIWVGVLAVARRRVSRPVTCRVDSRFDERSKSRFQGWLELCGQKCGVRGIDLHRSGALIASKVPAPPDSEVFLYIKSYGLMGWATVKHCSRYGMFKYRIGLEFRGSLMRAREGKWRFATVRHQDDEGLS
jgi:hypothetical protein